MGNPKKIFAFNLFSVIIKVISKVILILGMTLVLTIFIHFELSIKSIKVKVIPKSDYHKIFFKLDYGLFRSCAHKLGDDPSKGLIKLMHNYLPIYLWVITYPCMNYLPIYPWVPIFLPTHGVLAYLPKKDMENEKSTWGYLGPYLEATKGPT